MKPIEVTVNEVMQSPPTLLEPYYEELIQQPLTEANLEDWMTQWSEVRKLVDESYARLQLNGALDTIDEDASAQYSNFIMNTYPTYLAKDQQAKDMLIESGLVPEGMERSIAVMKAESSVFLEENLMLEAEERKLGTQYDKIVGNQSVEWQGEETTLTQLEARTLVPDRQVREEAWRLGADCWLQNREAINEIWCELLDVRQEITSNLGLPDFRSVKWPKLYRLDYTPDDSKQFLAAIEEVVVPVATQLYEEHAQRQGFDKVMPWDVFYNSSTFRFPTLTAYEDIETFKETGSQIFHSVHPRIGEFFDTMRQKELLDLENHRGKAPGAFCTSFATQQVPFVFMNAVGKETDIRTLFHESGHAFHVFQRSGLPYHHQWRANMEFNEVASTAMEFIASTYLEKTDGGFFDPADASRNRIQHIENKILFWPYMAVVVAFQHWAYENPSLSAEPSNCDAKWSELSDRFMPGVNWDGFEDSKATGWHRKLHIFRAAFYYIEYGLALLGAVQIWRNYLDDSDKAIEDYLAALALGGTASIPELYATAGAKFAFDAETLSDAVKFMIRTRDEIKNKVDGKGFLI